MPARTIWPRLWRRRPAFVGLVALGLTGAAWGHRHSLRPGDDESYHNRVFPCVHDVDGDTIDIDAPDGHFCRTRIRLWGVDTPETAKSNAGAMYYGDEASRFTRELVEHRQVRVVLSPLRGRDIYGRLLAYVYVRQRGEEIMLNEELIARGYAYADRRFDHFWRLRFEQLEEKAQKQRLGLWAKVRPEQMPPWRQRYLKRVRLDSLSTLESEAESVSGSGP